MNFLLFSIVLFSTIGVMRTIVAVVVTGGRITTTNKLYELGKRYKTDKITHHEYHINYDPVLRPISGTTDGILEIGVHEGASLNMWLDYFPNAFIYGMDIGKEAMGARYKIFKGDQNSEEDIARLKTELVGRRLAFINDDGSHVPSHQLFTFNALFPLLNEGGIYIIEDVETSYWRDGSLYGYNVKCGYKHPDSIVEIFKDVADSVNAEFAGERATRVQHYDKIGSITFAPNCIIIAKRTREIRPYRFAMNL